MYAFFDGDNIGKIIQVLLLENKVEEAVVFSDDLKKAFVEIKEYLSNHYENVEILILGGDDLLIYFDDKNDYVLGEIVSIFNTSMFDKTTISCGRGNTIEEAMYNLSKAKLFGKNQIYPSL